MLKNSKLNLFCAVAALALPMVMRLGAQAPASVAAKFAGTWKEDDSKRKIGSVARLRFQKSKDGGLEEHRGPEVKPLVQPIRFGAPAYPIDGSDNTIAWKKTDEQHFERTIFVKGQLMATRKITLSADGKSLTEATDRKLADGKQGSLTVAYQRTSGDKTGLVGVWTAQSVKVLPAPQMKLEAASAALKFSNDQAITYTLTLDEKPVKVVGPTVITGTTAAGKVVNDRTIELTNGRDGTVSGKTTWALSADGKTLTSTSTNVTPGASSEPSVSVFVRQ